MSVLCVRWRFTAFSDFDLGYSCRKSRMAWENLYLGLKDEVYQNPSSNTLTILLSAFV